MPPMQDVSPQNAEDGHPKKCDIGMGRETPGNSFWDPILCRFRRFSGTDENVSSKTKGPGEEGAAGYCPKSLLLKRATMVLYPFHYSIGLTGKSALEIGRLRIKGSILTPPPTPEFLSKDFCLQPGLELQPCVENGPNAKSGREWEKKKTWKLRTDRKP